MDADMHIIWANGSVQKVGTVWDKFCERRDSPTLSFTLESLSFASVKKIITECSLCMHEILLGECK